MDKSLVKALPGTRQYTLIEAVFSYQVDMDNGTIKTFREYARIWDWSKNKVIGFIRDKQGTRTEHAKDTHGTVKFRFIKPLYNCKGQAKDEQGTDSGHAGDTTINPNPILNTEDNIYVQFLNKTFVQFYEEYPKHEGKANAEKAWFLLWQKKGKSNGSYVGELTNAKFQKVMTSLKKQKESRWSKTEKRYIPLPSSWLRKHRWEDELSDKDNSKDPTKMSSY